MKCLKATLSYFFDKGAQMVLLSVVPALMTALLLSPSAGLYYLACYKDLHADSFASLYEQMHFLPYDFYWVGIIGLVLCFVVLALLFGIVDRHMRVGEFTISFRRAETRSNSGSPQAWCSNSGTCSSLCFITAGQARSVRGRAGLCFRSSRGSRCARWCSS